jgi:DnaK suppressor protein
LEVIGFFFPHIDPIASNQKEQRKKVSVTYDRLLQRLKEEQARLVKGLEQSRADASSSMETREGSPFGKKEEGASETFELEKRLALEKQLKDLLGEVEHALYKFERGTYGLCDICGQDIGLARLEVLPQANLCLNCKEHQAKSAKGRAPSR